MARAKRVADWDHTATVVATQINGRPGLKPGQFVSPVDVHPLRRRQRRTIRGAEAHATLDAAFGV